jgi:two-component system cell cycle response regulator DivK
MRPLDRPVILIVDDFADALEMYQEYLTFEGYEIAVARGGREAFRIAKANRPALILMDLRMPGMTGGEALKMFRSDPCLCDVPVVAFTAHALEDEKQRALLDGFDEVISKPCLPNDLRAAIDRLLADAAHE